MASYLANKEKILNNDNEIIIVIIIYRETCIDIKGTRFKMI